MFTVTSTRRGIDVYVHTSRHRCFVSRNMHLISLKLLEEREKRWLGIQNFVTRPSDLFCHKVTRPTDLFCHKVLWPTGLFGHTLKLIYLKWIKKWRCVYTYTHTHIWGNNHKVETQELVRFNEYTWNKSRKKCVCTYTVHTYMYLHICTQIRVDNDKDETEDSG